MVLLLLTEFAGVSHGPPLCPPLLDSSIGSKISIVIMEMEYLEKELFIKVMLRK